jgi:hypoxanthine phosphoribosyltransferase
LTKELTWEELDRLTDEGIKRLKTDNFCPDVIIGIARAGAITGRVLAHKLKTPFKIDYRRMRKGYADKLILDKDEKKILIVDYICDTGRTFLASRIDLLDNTKPKDNLREWLDDIYFNTQTKIPSYIEIRKKIGIEIRFLSLFYHKEGSKIWDMDYYCKPSVKDTPEASLKYHTNEKSLKALQKSAYTWKNEVSELVKEMGETYVATSERTILPKIPPLSGELISVSNHLEKINFIYEIELSDSGKQLKDETFKNDFDEKSLVTIENNKIYMPIEKCWFSGEYRISDLEDSKSLLTITFSHQEDHITNGDSEMCGNCPVRETEIEKEGLNGCFICTQYLDSIKFLGKILREDEKWRYSLYNIECNVFNKEKGLFQLNNKKISEDLDSMNG